MREIRAVYPQGIELYLEKMMNNACLPGELLENQNTPRKGVTQKGANAKPNTQALSRENCTSLQTRSLRKWGRHTADWKRLWEETQPPTMMKHPREN